MFLEDKELLHQFKQPLEKERAFTGIIKKYQEKLYWHIRRIVVDHDDANDILQNMFIKVWNSLENFREDSQLYTWLYRIATNECFTFLEQLKRRSSVSLSDVHSFALFPASKGLFSSVPDICNFCFSYNYICTTSF